MLLKISGGEAAYGFGFISISTRSDGPAVSPCLPFSHGVSAVVMKNLQKETNEVTYHYRSIMRSQKPSKLHIETPQEKEHQKRIRDQ